MNAFTKTAVLAAALIPALLSLPAAGVSDLIPPPGERTAKSMDVRMKEALSSRLLNNVRMTIHAVNLKTGKPLFSLNPDLALNPASVAKVVTSAVALDRLGPAFRMPTEVYAGSQPEKGVIKGPIYIKGYGDPRLVNENLLLFVNELRNIGLSRIDGGIVIDESAFDDMNEPEGWDKIRGEGAYYAGTAAFPVNFNSVTVTVIPADPGEKPAVVVTPGIPYFTVDNLAKTVKSGGPSLSIGMDSAGKGEKITVSGTIGAPGPAKPYYRRVEKPVMYAGTVLKTMLESGGIKVSGRVSGGKVPNNAALLYTHNSDPLSIIVRDMNKYSNNFTAEQVVKVLGAKPGVPASFSDGLAAIADGLQKFGVQGEYTMTNGSGLSHKNAFSARQIVQVLLHAWNSFVWGPDFVSSLSIGGDDGTVRKRYKGSFLEHSVRVKTGSIDRVSSLAGYLVSASGDPIAFCIIFNGFPAASCRDMTDLEDRIAEILSGSTIRER